MKDFLAKPLSLGDDVVTTPKYYRGLVKAKIIAFTPQNVRVEYRDHADCLQTFLTPPNTLIKF